ncbi:MAG: ComF family protein, partial [Rikenellaceae bacterium]
QGYDIFVSALSLVMPRLCPICKTPIARGYKYICPRCLLDSPTTGFETELENKMAERVKSLSPYIEEASSLIYYIKGSCWVALIHEMKYSGYANHAERLGEWLGYVLRGSELYSQVDVVIAIPLHPLRHMARGYNQSDLIARGCAKSMGVESLHGVVRRRRLNRPQVKIDRNARWDNVEDLFRVNNVERLRGRNILLVDDVFTTGATILSCADEIHNVVPDCRIWIATVAVAYGELGVESR